MPQQQSSNTLPSSVRKWKTEDVFLALNHTFRRENFRSLAISPKTALQINGGSGLRRYTSLKQLSLLCQAGIVVQTKNAEDRRQPFYSLAPAVVMCHAKDHFTVDFGCCMLRFAKYGTWHVPSVLAGILRDGQQGFRRRLKKYSLTISRKNAV